MVYVGQNIYPLDKLHSSCHLSKQPIIVLNCVDLLWSCNILWVNNECSQTGNKPSVMFFMIEYNRPTDVVWIQTWLNCFMSENSGRTLINRVSKLVVGLGFPFYTVSQKKRATLLWRQLSQILTDFQNSFTAGKSIKFPTKQFTTLPTMPKMCCHTTARNLNV